MANDTLVLTFDWVVERLVVFNKAQFKNKKMVGVLRYILRLAALRGCKFGDCFFQMLCHSSVSIKQIQKTTKKLAAFVSVEEMKLLLHMQ